LAIGGTEMSDTIRETTDQSNPRVRQRMKAAVHERYGPPDVVELREIEKPTPRDNEVLIKIHAAAASTPDSEMRRLKLPLFFAVALRLYIGLIHRVHRTVL